MGEIWKGAPVAQALTERLIPRAKALTAQGVPPTLAIVRVGERPEDLSYERGALKRCETAGITVKRFHLPETASQEELLSVIHCINEEQAIHGCLLFRPFPRHMDEKAVCESLAPAKDMDGITSGSLASVFSGTGEGYPPCTAQACVEMLHHYGCDLTGKRVVVVGRSLVVGRPLAMLLLHEHATVTLCHTRTRDLPGECRRAEVLIAAAGKANMLGTEHLSPGQLVLDVGINVDEHGHLVGDVSFAAAQDTAAAVTPVPGGVGAVTTSVLAAHVILAAERAAGR